MVPSPPAEETAAARGAVEVCAMPARRTGCWMRRSVVRGVVRGGRAAAVVGVVGWGTIFATRKDSYVVAVVYLCLRAIVRRRNGYANWENGYIAFGLSGGLR